MSRHFSPAFLQRACCGGAIFLGLLSGGEGAPYGPEGKAVEFTQPDGTKLKLRVFGDEFYARTETADGYTVVFDPASKTYFYAVLSADRKRLEPTKLKARAGEPTSISIPKHIQLDAAAIKEQARSAQERWEAGTGTEQRWRDLKARSHKADATNGAKASTPKSTNDTKSKSGSTGAYHEEPVVPQRD